MGTRPLLVPEEGRYAEIIREMLVSHDYVTPHLNGVKYFEKPVLFYWLGLFVVKTIGINIWTLRSVNAVFGLLGCLLTYVAGRKFYDRRTGVYAALVLAASGLYFGMLHIINVDLSATIFIALSLYSFLFALQQEFNFKRRLFIWLAFAAAACAVMTKGLVGIIFPAMIVGVWILVFNQWRILRFLYLPSAIVIFCLIAIPWHWLVSLRNPEFLHFYFVEQQFMRYATTEIGHYQPVWFFVPVLLAGFFPWIVFLPQTVKMIWSECREKKSGYQIDVFFLIWVGLIFVFFSFSKSKLVSYILPIFPPLAMLVGHYFAEKITQGRKLILLWCLTIILLLACMPILSMNNTSSTVALAAIIKERLKPGDEVVTYKQYYQDLPFYLDRTVMIVDWRGELMFGSQHQNTRAWLIDDKTFWRKWKNAKRLYVITDQNEFEQLRMKYPKKKFRVLGRTSTSVLFTR